MISDRSLDEAPPARRARFWGTPPTEDGAVDVWLISYADMVTLLMTVFIILVLMAGTAGGERRHTDDSDTAPHGFPFNLFELRAMSAYADESDYLVVAKEGASTPFTPEQRKDLAVIKKQDLERIQRRQDTLEGLRAELSKARLDDYISSDIEGDAVRITVPAPIIFGRGDTELDGRGSAVLRAMVPIFAAGTYTITVEGHTDNSPVLDLSRFPSNWELSAARAAVIVRFLVDQGIAPKRLEVAGFADTRPVMSNASEDGRATNRRVSFLLRM